jgi:hypothetical protein
MREDSRGEIARTRQTAQDGKGKKTRKSELVQENMDKTARKTQVQVEDRQDKRHETNKTGRTEYRRHDRKHTSKGKTRIQDSKCLAAKARQQ